MHLKQRLVGAIVLIALAVIFIPVVLDKDDGSSMPMFGSNIPDRPDHRFETLEIPLEAPLSIKPADRTVVESEAQAARLEARKPGAKPAAEAGEKKITASVSPSPDDPVVWVVQIGSFSAANNALELRDKIRGKGFAAFVEQVKGEKGVIYRVRIGPELDQDKARATQTELKDKLQLEGIVVRHR